MSDTLIIIAKLSAFTFIITSMLTMGLSLSLLMAVREEMGNRATRSPAKPSMMPKPSPEGYWAGSK